MKTYSNVLIFFITILLTCLFTPVSHVLAQTTEAEEIDLSNPEDPKPLGCYKLTWKGIKPYYWIGDPIHITAEMVWDDNCKPDFFCEGSYSGSIFFEGKKLKYFNSLKKGNSYEMNLNSDMEGSYSLKFELFHSCWGFGSFSPFTENEVKINIIKPEDNFTYQKYRRKGRTEFGADNCNVLIDDKEYVKKFKICNGIKRTYTIIEKNEKSTTNSDEWVVSYGIKAEGGLSSSVFSIKSYIEANRNFKISHKSTKSDVQYTETSFELESPPCGCVIPSYAMNYDLYELTTWKANCDPDKEDKLINVEEIHVPFGLYKTQGCIVPPEIGGEYHPGH